MHTEDFPGVFLPSCYGELSNADIEKLDAAVAARSQQLILVPLGPREVEEAVLSFEELLACDSLCAELEDIQAAIADQAKVGAGGDGEAGVEEGRVLDAVRVETLGPELEHGGRPEISNALYT